MAFSQPRSFALLMSFVLLLASRCTIRPVDAKEAEIQSSGETASDAADDDDDGVVFAHFVAHNKTMTCSADEHARPFNNQIRGVNLGGWMVLVSKSWLALAGGALPFVPSFSHASSLPLSHPQEPWITPSMFYQGLGKEENGTLFDMYTFCERLGAEEANKQLRRHWDAWVTEEIIQELANTGAVNSFRLPLGDFQFVPYGVYLCLMVFILQRLYYNDTHTSTIGV